MGRPSKYNDKIASEILRRFASGEKLTDICKLARMPSRFTVFTWKSMFPEFNKAYQSAMECYVDFLVAEGLTIVDTDPDAKRAKNRSDYRMWLAGKLHRSQYGDKIDVQHNITVDISPALSSAIDKMRSLGTGQAPLIEAECTPK